MATWNYQSYTKLGDAPFRVYVKKHGETWTCSENPVCPEGETLDELREALKWYQRALEQSALEYADLARDYGSDSLDIEEPF